MISLSISITTLTCSKTNPTGIRYDVTVPMRRHKQDDSSCDANAANKNTDQSQEPLWLQVRGEAVLRPVVQSHTSPHQAKACVTWNLGTTHFLFLLRFPSSLLASICLILGLVLYRYYVNVWQNKNGVMKRYFQSYQTYKGSSKPTAFFKPCFYKT